MKIFPIGTSRLHEPLTLIDDEVVAYPKMGYFHSSSQALDIFRILHDEKCPTLDISRLFFRKDSTKPNPFDANLWTEKFANCLENIKNAYNNSDTVMLEISTPRTYRFKGFHVQGNPNYYMNASYSEVWKVGYYKIYAPEIDVEVFDDYEAVESNLSIINHYLDMDNKNAIVLGHLVDPKNINTQRLKNNQSLVDAIANARCQKMNFYDQAHLVDKYGFRVLDNGIMDIHHLPWIALKEQMTEIIKMINQINSRLFVYGDAV